MDFTTFFPSNNKKVGHLTVRVAGGLPHRIEGGREFDSIFSDTKTEAAGHF